MIQIVNGGVLPDGWTVDTLLSSHRSMPYNPDIANTFFRAGEVEAWGRGIERIIKGCQEDGFSTVDFCYDACGLWTTFRYQYPARVVGDTENVHETTLVGHETTKKTTKKATKKTSAIQDEILNCLQKNPYATVKEVQMQFKSMTIDGIQYHIKRLKSMGLLKRIGPDKGGYWQVVDIQ